ncbi:MAG: formylglycine-generating enzyme family protein, partial [bacterium]
VITAGAGMHGVVAPSGVVEVAYGGSTNFVVTADAYYHIGSLLTNGVSVGAATNQLVYTSVWANVIASGVFAATFAENLTINTGTPEWWLAQYGWTNNFEIAAVNDTDGDDMQAWTEYLAGTDPTNRSSFLGFDSIAPEINGAGIVIRWSSVTDKVYQLDYSVNLPLGFSTLRADILATPPENAYTDTVTGVPVKFYRVALNQPAPSGMVLIPAGNNSGSDPDFGAYTLTVSAFYMDSTLVTKAKWDEVYIWALTNGYSFTNAGSVKATNHPVQTVNWHDCAKWCNARSEKEGRPVSYRVGGSVYRGVADNSVTCATNVAGYRLPTDVEFHYAARGGLVGKRFPWGDTIDHTKANYWGYPASSGGYAYDTGSYGYDTRFNTGGEPYTSPVDTFAANGYGLYDMAGNLWEWCTDWHPGYEGSERVLRGGCWNSDAYGCQVGSRFSGYPDLAYFYFGFRAVLPPGQ